MAAGILFRAQSAKPITALVDVLKEKARQFRFSVREIFDMRHVYGIRGVNVAGDFDVHSIMVCSFEGSYRSILQNPERAAVIFEARQILLYTRDGATIVNYLPFPKDFVKQVLPEDEAFAEGLAKSCQRVIGLMEACV